MPHDSSGKEIVVGDRVRFRGQKYTIKNFMPGLGRFGTSAIEFEEAEVHTLETPDEVSVDKVRMLYAD